MADMDAPGAELSAGAFVDVQDGSTDELWSFDGEKFEKIEIFENFSIAILDPLAPPSVENGQPG